MCFMQRMKFKISPALQIIIRLSRLNLKQICTCAWYIQSFEYLREWQQTFLIPLSYDLRAHTFVVKIMVSIWKRRHENAKFFRHWELVNTNCANVYWRLDEEIRGGHYFRSCCTENDILPSAVRTSGRSRKLVMENKFAVSYRGIRKNRRGIKLRRRWPGWK